MTDLSPTYRRLLRLLSYSIYAPADQMSALGSPLSDRQWYKIIEEAEKQTVSGVVFEALSRLPDSEMPSLSVLAPWLAMTHRGARTSEAMSEVLGRVFTLFRSKGLHPLLQKGHAVARFYPSPALRAIGDIDLWFPADERIEADKIISGMGIKVVGTPDNGSRYVISGTDVEHHSMLVEIHNPFRSRYISSLCSKYQPAQISLGAGMPIDVPAPVIELLMINAHILKHCLGVGIGLRQFCDYALAWRSLAAPGASAPAVDAEEYFYICRQLGIGLWTSVLHQFVNRYLPSPDGSSVDPFPGEAPSNAVDRIFSLVAEGGNFGHYHPRASMRPHANVLRRKVNTMTSFLNNRSFVCNLAPAESFWTFARLLLGQIH